MSNIYDQHSAAFANVSAFVVTKGCERVATIAFKRPKDGEGRLWVYVHLIGMSMVRGHANGFGYDKHTAACAAAVNGKAWRDAFADALDNYRKEDAAFRENGTAIHAALTKDEGPRWSDQLEKAGFQVWQAV